ncbi:MAG: heme exporter protein CcmD [Pseudomonadota bacterium]
MPDLGDYAGYVLGSYGATLAILAVVIGLSLRNSARARRELERLEARHGRRRKGGET